MSGSWPNMLLVAPEFDRTQLLLIFVNVVLFALLTELAWKRSLLNRMLVLATTLLPLALGYAVADGFDRAYLAAGASEERADLLAGCWAVLVTGPLLFGSMRLQIVKRARARLEAAERAAERERQRAFRYTDRPLVFED